MDFAARAAGYRDRIEAALDRCLPPASAQPARLHGAMRYAVLGGGKRIRALLTYAAGEWLGLPAERLDGIATAIELVHAYSLVHDDLPAMDNDDLRRGRPTTHIAYDEATAILVGDALQAHAYHVLANGHGPETTDESRRLLVIDLARASGSAGMAGGQALDMAATGRAPDAAELETVYRLKTGCLLEAAVMMPSRLQPVLRPDERDSLAAYARAVGLAFQIADDLLDIESPAAVTGKPQGSDERNGKATWPAAVGAAAARERLAALRLEAHSALGSHGRPAEGLAWFCDQVVRRNA
jgi:farnesyl diphosphate synthase